MTMRPYPSRSKIAAAAANAGHVVSTDTDLLRIETGAVTITFNPDKTITDGAGRTHDTDSALKALDLTLT